MKLLDSRRWPGANLLMDQPGAVLDVEVDPERSDALVAAWRRHLGAMLAVVDWSDQTLHVRAFEGGATLAFTAPIDALYAATEVNEWALEAAIAELEGTPAPNIVDDAAELKAAIEDEANPPLLALRDAAAKHGVAFLSDDDYVSLGLGTGSRVYPVRSLRAPEDIDWDSALAVRELQVEVAEGRQRRVRPLHALPGMELPHLLQPRHSAHHMAGAVFHGPRVKKSAQTLRRL